MASRWQSRYHNIARNITLIKRALSQGWWFAAFQLENEWHIAFAGSIDLQRDLRAKLSNLQFELD